MNLSRCKRCGYHYAPEKLESDTLSRHFGMCLDRAACSRRVKQREDDRKAVRADATARLNALHTGTFKAGE